MTIKKVLLVDDEPHIRRIGEISLKHIGKWNVLLAVSGADAIDLAVRQVPDVILLDMMMPDLDGAATLGRLRELPETAHIPVIFMTARAQRHEVEQYKSLGAMAVIAKPFDPMTLPARIMEIVDNSGELKTLTLSP